jgi:DNA-binding transcriptional MerR regulator
MAEGMTVTELAEVVGMTPRNVRAYQSRGLLYPPVISGRVAHYSAAHVARLHLIASLQREGFTLAAIKRIVDRPESYGAIVADRRRRFRDGSSDIVATVPVPEAAVRAAVPGLPDDLTETGLIWRDEGRGLVSHTLLVGVGRMLAAQGISEQVLADLQLDAAALGKRIGAMLREHLVELIDDAGNRADLARIAVQLSATAYEIAFLEAATADGHHVAQNMPT